MFAANFAFGNATCRSIDMLKGAFHLFGWAVATRQSLQLMMSGLRLFSKQHLTASRALSSAFDRRHPARQKYGMHPLLPVCKFRMRTRHCADNSTSERLFSNHDSDDALNRKNDDLTKQDAFASGKFSARSSLRSRPICSNRRERSSISCA